MGIFKQLQNNKGTVSSALGKSLAQKVLKGNMEILGEAVQLISYKLDHIKDKNVRAGAAKILELVGMKKPDWLIPYAENFIPALEAEEPQTRWMVFRILGFCAKAKPHIAQKALPHAKQVILEKRAGQLCLASSVDLYLGDYGSTSKTAAQQAFPLLLISADNVLLNEHDWLMEAFLAMSGQLDSVQKKAVLSFASEYADHPRKKTLDRVKKIQHLLYE